MRSLISCSRSACSAFVSSLSISPSISSGGMLMLPSPSGSIASSAFHSTLKATALKVQAIVISSLKLTFVTDDLL